MLATRIWNTSATGPGRPQDRHPEIMYNFRCHYDHVDRLPDISLAETFLQKLDPDTFCTISSSFAPGPDCRYVEEHSCCFQMNRESHPAHILLLLRQ